MHSRRQFIKNASCAAIGGVTLGSTLLNFRSLNAAVQNSASYLNNDYRAMVCILLGGGNDSYNMLVPADSTAINSRYDIYKKSRSNLALPFNSVLKSTGLQNNGNPLGLHPALSSVKQMFDSGELA
ncbi:MAG TPA: twin-arginine translocation signal domain-containing protein, partial [Saprospiraceae bacterium]|nr:twin-arginine translocation signal domain-containing protein [Saprospiraceae bacterium]